METVADRINRILDTEKIKKRDLAKRLKISDSSVSTMCSGKSNPSGQTITMICKEFGIWEEWLKYGTGEMYAHKELEPLGELLSGLLDGENVTDEDRILIKNFLELPDNSRKAVIEFVQKCAEELSAPTPPTSDTDVTAKLAELERQNKEIMAQSQALAAEIAAIREEDAEQEKADLVSASATLSQFR